MSRPFMLYHWSPRARRKSILRNGLCPGKLSQDASWRPPYVCFCRFPNVAWALSATHSGKRGRWDLWCVWSDVVAEYATLNTASNPRACWWTTEYRFNSGIPNSRIWHVGTREFKPRKSHCA